MIGIIQSVVNVILGIVVGYFSTVIVISIMKERSR